MHDCTSSLDCGTLLYDWTVLLLDVGVFKVPEDSDIYIDLKGIPDLYQSEVSLKSVKHISVSSRMFYWVWSYAESHLLLCNKEAATAVSLLIWRKVYFILGVPIFLVMGGVQTESISNYITSL